MKLRYFAWVRERIGIAEEEIELPGEISDVASLMAWLSRRDEGYAAAFAEPSVIRAAIDREHVGHETPIAEAREVAFFPPMTGG